MTPGEQIGPFTIGQELGSGAMGSVYKATYHKDGRDYPVAFKVVSFGLLGNEGVQARFAREADILWLDNLVAFLLEKDKEKRPLDAATVGRMLAEISEKVSAGKSVGAEVANARRVDRPLGDAPLDAADKEAARSLRKPGKKRKKKKGDGKWGRIAQAAGLLAALAALVGFGAYMLWPEGIDKAYAKVEAAPTPEGRAEAAAQFLKDYGGSADDERVKKAFDLYTAGKAQQAEKVLAKRLGSRIESNPGDYPEEAYRSAIQAMHAERAGELDRAADLWTAAKKAAPAAAPARLTEEGETTRAVLGWVADRRLADIREGVPAALARVRKQIADDRTFDRDWKYAPTDPEGQAARALLLEDAKDKPKARRVWEGLVRQTEADPDQRAWFLLASRQAAGGGDKLSDDEAAAARRQQVTAAVTGLERVWEQVKADPDKRAEQRDVRNGCRELIALYADDPTEPVKVAVERAKKLLEAATAK